MSNFVGSLHTCPYDPQYPFQQLVDAVLILKIEHILLILQLVFCLLAHSSLKILAMQKYEIIQKEKRRIAP